MLSAAECWCTHHLPLLFQFPPLSPSLFSANKLSTTNPVAVLESASTGKHTITLKRKKKCHKWQCLMQDAQRKFPGMACQRFSKFQFSSLVSLPGYEFWTLTEWVKGAPPRSQLNISSQYSSCRTVEPPLAYSEMVWLQASFIHLYFVRVRIQ